MISASIILPRYAAKPPLLDRSYCLQQPSCSTAPAGLACLWAFGLQLPHSVCPTCMPQMNKRPRTFGCNGDLLIYHLEFFARSGVYFLYISNWTCWGCTSIQSLSYLFCLSLLSTLLFIFQLCPLLTSRYFVNSGTEYIWRKGYSSFYIARLYDVFPNG